MSTDITKATQTQEILDYMKAGNHIDPLKALNFFGCFRLAARIADIRRMGYEVNSKLVLIVHPNGATKKYKEYWINE